MSFPLEGVTVVALEQAVAAPLATRHLSDLGARVIKLERPGSGDFARKYDSSVHGVSSYFAWLNRGKASLTLNFKEPSGRDVLESLLDRADVFVSNLKLETISHANLLPESVRETRPRLICCLVSGYGMDGPYSHRKAYDLLLQGESGLLSVSGTEDQPAKMGVSIVDISAGVYASMAILGAILRRVRTGEGASIDISLLETAAEWMGSPLYYFLGTGSKLSRAGMRHSLIVPYGPYACREGGHINLAVQNEREWESFCQAVLERPEMAGNPEFRTNERRLSNRHAVESIIEEVFSELPREVLIQRLEDAGIAWGDFNDVEGLANHKQLESRGRWAEIEVNGFPFSMLDHPMNISGMPPNRSSVHRLGEDTDDVLRWLGYDEGQIRGLRESDVV